MAIGACVTELCYVDLRVTTRQDTVGYCVSFGSVGFVVGGNRDIKIVYLYIYIITKTTLFSEISLF